MKQFSRFDLGMMIAFGVVALFGSAIAIYLSGAIFGTGLAQSQADLAAAQADMDALASKQTYNPIAANELILKNNIQLLKSQIDPVVQAKFKSSENDISSIHNQASVIWKNDLDSRVKKLRQLANENQVTIPKNYYFGFSRYLSQNPRDDTTGELSKQLDYLEKISTILLKNHALAIQHLRRTYDEDEESASVRDSADQIPGRVTQAASGLYLDHPFELDFDSNTVALRQIINDLAASPYVFIVRVESIENSHKESPNKSDLEKMAEPNASATAPPVSGTSPGATADTGTSSPRPTKGPQYLFGSEFVKVQLRVDAIEWIGLSESSDPNGAKKNSKNASKP